VNWDDTATFVGPLEELVYGSRLIGADPDLVLHGGGNTSVKITQPDVTGEPVEVLHVKGSGWDLASIEPAGFAPLRLARLRELLTVPQLSDRQMMNELRCALLDAAAPDPSVETLLHALLPHRAVLHSHADAILALTNTEDGANLVRSVYGNRVVVVPYVMPGFLLARACAAVFAQEAHDATVGIVLLNHGLFTFGDTTREAYHRHLDLVAAANVHLAQRIVYDVHAHRTSYTMPTPVGLAEFRAEVSKLAGRPMIVSRHDSQKVREFVGRADLESVAGRGPVTPDHVIRTKRVPLVGRDLAGFAARYREYFVEHRGERELTMLDPAPRVVLDPEWGMLTIGERARDADIARDIYEHTIRVVERAEALGGYRALSPGDIFDVEYWELEQAKLLRGTKKGPLVGETALVTGAASGIGRACVDALRGRGASVIGVDLDPMEDSQEYLGVQADVTDPEAMRDAIEQGVRRFGGLDMVIPSAGVFPATKPIAELDPEQWRRTMAVNVDAIADLLRQTHPLLAHAPRGGRVVVIASKNVAAPGPGAAAYSASKAAVTQLARVAAIEWANHNIRVNIVHPDAVFDTALWTETLVAERAEHYGMTIEQYKRRNLLGREIASADVANVVAELCTDTYKATTGAQIPIDGGNERVI
jgi:rhamnose utilization protein RhaD (predicted bifunctional aldolase and dehydrogenase)/NAD(P)-dependent dehydrogenase (short-subunit alcohol dehydrogenase family)